MLSEALAWLNPTFLEGVLRRYEDDETLRVEDSTKVPAVEAGVNFTSAVIRANVEYSTCKSGARVIKYKSLVIKVAPISDGLQKDLVKEIECFETEIRMLKETLPRVKKLLDDEECYLNAEVLHAEIGEPSVIVMEDLGSLGYRMAKRRSGLDLDHCLLVMRTLAKLHAASVSIFEKDPQAVTSYTKSSFHEDNPESLKRLFTDAIRNLSYEVGTWKQLGPNAQSYAEKLLKLSKVSYEKATECSRPKENAFNVLNHGDLSVNNMMFRYDDADKIINPIFVDYQICSWGSPALDVLRFISSSSSEDVDVNYRPTLLREYLSTLTKTMLKLGCTTKPPDMPAFKKALEEHEITAVIISIVGLRILLARKEDALSFDDVFKDDQGPPPQPTQNLDYQRIISRRLLDWNERGVLDV